MKELFVQLAKYNGQVNDQLITAIEGAPEGTLTRPVGSYFSTVLGLLNHVLVSDLGWLNSYRGSDVALASLQSEVLDFEHPGWRNNLYDDLASLKQKRREVDAVLRALADELTDEMLAGGIVLGDPKGNKHRFVFGQVLLHLFNHQTHHRGALSQLLDGLEIENDFSNLLSVIPREEL